MGVICRPLDCHGAIESPELAPQAWSNKMPESTIFELVPTKDFHWQPEKEHQIQVSPTRVKRLHKRSASVSMTSFRTLKRQRVAVQSTSNNVEKKTMPGVGSPRSLQFALPRLTSTDTLRVLHTMHSIPSELRHLNGSASRNHLKRHNKVQQAFGWRHLLCQEEESEAASSRVIWKSAKAFDAVGMRPLARQIWQSGRSQVLYTVNNVARVVRCTKRQLGGTRDQIWLECFHDDGLQVCVARKELRHFGEYHAPETSATECQGYLVRPVCTKAIRGCTLQSLRAVDARESDVGSLKRQLIQDLPRFTLQWEEDYIYDLVAAPQVLVDSVFTQE